MDVKEIIKKAFIFTPLTDDEVSKLEGIAKIRKYNSGDIIFEEGSEGGCLCIVCEGRVNLMKKLDKEKETCLAEIDENGFFGEISLFDQKPQIVTAVAEEETVLLSFDYPALRGLLVIYSEMARKIFNQVLKLQSNLLRQTNERIRKFLQKATE
ncbi:MAG: hypothetical protein B6D57_01655 [Candidatus Coatesbacteria bacterium 4484_99]|uniref:Cyclic nucleotide-binding domain-containing protein n=1 Tax=Candidatus Coatesbacteria bacterium 4484_99 TaxID=1970774 RepID=A0A1W9S211_9BACT|nr:MAG: hypothetical protein B6D57_01655 [Candidatus Coatesbacteria bacterium 4484_99]RLC41295.1 MAG: hypothetical protein DRH51_03520 [Candidatus Coatesbacteria bacterium]